MLGVRLSREASGVALDLAKTGFVPLGGGTPDTPRQELAHRFPGWGAAGVRGWADYLGFTLGPDSRDRSWRKALVQYTHRSELWAQLGMGLYYTSVAYNIYIASLLGFLLQLEVLPDGWEAVEAAALRRLVPGPARWILPADLHALRIHHGLSAEFTDMQEVSFAARFRVAYREASASGGLAVAAATRRLDTLRLDSELLAHEVGGGGGTCTRTTTTSPRPSSTADGWASPSTPLRTTWVRAPPVPTPRPKQ